MLYVYLFEVKSIQQYLFGSGKLKDVISASERLDRLIDNSENSVLNIVLNAANLPSDLLSENESTQAIKFLRCKGGAFYATCESSVPLEKLRSLWTLTINQMFPSLVFVDALTQGTCLNRAIDSGHQALAAARNTPKVNIPYAPALVQRSARTGKAAIPLSRSAIKASTADHDDSALHLDVDTERHRQAYQNFELRRDAALQHRFTPESLRGEIGYPIDFEDEFEFADDSAVLNHQQRDAIKDMALIHIDGNGLGILLMKLKSALNNESERRFRQTYRAFSDALNIATVKAAQQATQWLYDQLKRQQATSEGNERVMLPMRPIVLGGDDITLFCRADLALGYARQFCKVFKVQSEIEIKKLPVQSIGVSYLTASGGILYCKASHPFMQSHNLVEALCEKAKKLTKSVVGLNNVNHVGPAALAFHRLSNTSQQSLDEIVATSQHFEQQVNGGFSMGQGAYLVEDNDLIEKANLSHRKFDFLDALVEKSSADDAPVSLSRWRQMATEIANGQPDEAERIFERGLDLSGDRGSANEFRSCVDNLNPSTVSDSSKKWYWETDYGYQTIINDLLIMGHYQLLSNQDEAQ
ncbi:hypothetical protein FCV73_05575 [Vibrio sp. F13]|uniref:Cas10/Cmr2 second palm domain-containing protein n=2 Tax=Vibrio TaxID=662 RepID=UPI0010BD3612|nr:hypothetical protein [Vibrio sp. F13]TKF92575.1 hypothetical protein FCV73_05575 [Vibrio sp. F13]